MLSSRGPRDLGPSAGRADVSTSTLLEEITLQGTKFECARVVSQVLRWIYQNIWVAVGGYCLSSGVKRIAVRGHSRGAFPFHLASHGVDWTN